MSQSTTTSVSLGPILDLPGPGAPSAGANQTLPTFDALLRPLARSAAKALVKPSSDAVDPAQNQAQPVSTAEQPIPLELLTSGDDPSQSKDEQSSSADVLLVESLAGTATITPPTPIEPRVATEEDANAGDRAPSDAGELAPSRAGEQWHSNSAEQVSLTVSKPPPNKAREQAPSAIREQFPSDYVEQLPSAARDQPASAPAVSVTQATDQRASISRTSAAPSTTAVISSQSELEPAPTSNARASTNATPAESRANPSLGASQQHPVTTTTKTTTGAAEVTVGPKTESSSKTAALAEPSRILQAVSDAEPANTQSPVPSPESPASSQTLSENPPPTASSRFTTDSPDRRNDDSGQSEISSQSDPAASELAAEPENTSAHAPSAPESTHQPPTPASQQSPLTFPDSNQFAATSNTATPLASLPAPRARFPAEVLVQPTTASSRRSNPSIDTKSLLTRVARAFAAAQERDGEIRLRLSPPELGSLRLDLRIQDSVMVASLQTETEAARTAIIENLPALRERLSDQGVRIERFDVDLMHRQPGGTPDQPGGHEPQPQAAPQLAATAPRPRTPPATIARPSPAAASTSGLNVIV